MQEPIPQKIDGETYKYKTTKKDNITYYDVTQQTPEWFALKVLRPFSASNATAIASQGKGLESLVKKAIQEKYSTSLEDVLYNNFHTDKGNDREAQAVKRYDGDTTLAGFITNDKFSELCGVSPDALVGDDGLLEVKSPSDKIYTDRLLELAEDGEFKIDSGYMWQMQMQLLISEREWVDFCIFNPNFPKDILIQRVFPDEEMQEKLRAGIEKAEKMFKTKDKVIHSLMLQ